MKRTDAGLHRRVNLALVAALLVTMVFAGAVAAKPVEPMAPYVPNLPHCFTGMVTTTRGIGLPGAQVVARAVAGYWTGQVTAIVNTAGQYTLCVPGYDSSTRQGAKPGDLIGFYVNGVWAATHVFQYGGGTLLNLVVPLQETINASAGPNCTIDPEGAVRVDFGMDQTFTFEAAEGYQVWEVFVDDVANPAAAAAGMYTFTNVRETHSIRVTCIKSTWTITATAGAGCTITPSGAQTVNVFDDITFTIGAQTGYTLTDVKVDGASKGPLAQYTFENVMADHTISATCTRTTFRIFLPFIHR